MVDVNCGVTRMIDGTVRLETEAGNFNMTPKQARQLSNLLSEASVEPPTWWEIAFGVSAMAGVIAVVVIFIVFCAPE